MAPAPVVAFAVCPPTGVIIDLFDEVTARLAAGAGEASGRPVVALVSEPVALPPVDGREQVSFRRPLGLLTPSGVRLLRDLRRRRPDTLFVWTQHPLAVVPMLALRRSLTVAWWHEPRHRGQVGRVKALAYRAFELLVVRRADVVLVASPTVLAQVPERLQASTRVVPFPALRTFDTPSDRYASTPTDLVFFGVVLPHKGLDVLADALELLAGRGAHPTLRIVGPGNLAAAAPRMTALAAERPRQVVVEQGYLPAGDVASAVTASRCVVLPYLSATGSATTAIAHRLGRPVIASAVGAFVDEITPGTDGWLVPPGDAVALADAIERGLDGPAPRVTPRRDDEAWLATFLDALDGRR